MREVIEGLIQKLNKADFNAIWSAAKREGKTLNYDELRIYLNLRDARISMGDMYEFIVEIEVNLHKGVKNTFIAEYGESKWWREGIPSDIRKECASMLEGDPEPAAEPFCYTTLMQLHKVLDKKWDVLSKTLPGVLEKDKKGLLNDIAKLNYIRNCVMHPVKGIPITEEDFQLVRDLRERLRLEKWNIPQSMRELFV
ncbi:MAG TPA: hypothetical protein VF508_02175, partial [Pyrinomonadaceae bacterium]|jgi:hypothetical protein